MNDLMLDLETLGTNPTSVIIQIGACYFDRYTGEIGKKNITNVDIGSCLMEGMLIDQATVDWWKEQSNKSWMIGKSFGIHTALTDFQIFAKEAKQVWSHATFDVPILMNAYKLIGKKPPFHYRCARDIRTLVDLANLRYEPKGDEKTHNALEDCERQVKYCVECFNRLKGKE